MPSFHELFHLLFLQPNVPKYLNMYKQAQEFNLLHFITCVIPTNNQAVEVPQAYPTHSSNNCTHDAYILPNLPLFTSIRQNIT